MEDLLHVWPEAIQILEEELPPVAFNTWIKTIRPLSISEHEIVLEVPYVFNKTMLLERYRDLVKNALYLVLGRDISLTVVVEGETVPQADPLFSEMPQKETSPKTAYLNPQYTFDTYVIGNSNKFAHAAAMAVSEAPSILYNPFFIYGGVGLGKTHLMNAIGNQVLSIYPEKKVMYVSSEQFTNELINSIREQKNEEFRNKYRTIDVLMIDDIQFIAGKTSSEEEFFHTFNTLYLANKQIIISSDRPPKELHTLEGRLRTRFESGLIVDIQPPDFETRAAILKQKAEQFHFTVDDEVLKFIAGKITSNIRELEGAIKKLIVMRGLEGKPVSVAMAEEALKDFNLVKNNVITPERIIDAVEKHFNLRENSLKSARKTKEIAYPRQIAMYIIRELTDLSYPKIGQVLGGRDHTTVLHGVSKIENDYASDITIKNLVDDIVKNIKHQ